MKKNSKHFRIFLRLVAIIPPLLLIPTGFAAWYFLSDYSDSEKLTNNIGYVAELSYLGKYDLNTEEYPTLMVLEEGFSATSNGISFYRKDDDNVDPDYVYIKGSTIKCNFKSMVDTSIFDDYEFGISVTINAPASNYIKVYEISGVTDTIDNHSIFIPFNYDRLNGLYNMTDGYSSSQDVQFNTNSEATDGYIYYSEDLTLNLNDWFTYIETKSPNTDSNYQEIYSNFANDQSTSSDNENITITFVVKG